MIPNRRFFENIASAQAVAKVFLNAEYTSYWQEGEVETPAVLSIERSGTTIHTETAEYGDDYESHIRDELGLNLGDQYYGFALDMDGTLADGELPRLIALLSSKQVVMSETECRTITARSLSKNFWDEFFSGNNPTVSSDESVVLFQELWFATSQLLPYSEHAPTEVPDGWLYYTLHSGVVLVAKPGDEENSLRVGFVLKQDGPTKKQTRPVIEHY